MTCRIYHSLILAQLAAECSAAKMARSSLDIQHAALLKDEQDKQRERLREWEQERERLERERDSTVSALRHMEVFSREKRVVGTAWAKDRESRAEVGVWLCMHRV